ncbi:hypothetical protein, partial [Bacteroides heparinolyticus]|uniref:hypothetical protein n=1 Tax=Prevotella heparinolytica TaxID=28113 RepID=UPI0035A07370
KPVHSRNIFPTGCSPSSLAKAIAYIGLRQTLFEALGYLFAHCECISATRVYISALREQSCFREENKLTGCIQQALFIYLTVFLPTTKLIE